MSRLALIVPVLNEAATLAAALDRLQLLRRQGAQLVVADGGSTDASWAIARPRADVLVLAPQGRAAQMNAGAQASRADVLLFLHADTRLPDDAWLQIAQALEAGALWGRFDVRLDSAHPALRMVGAAINLRSRLSGIATGDQAMFVRRAVYVQQGGFAPLPLMEDVDLSARLRRLARPACLRGPVTTSARRWERHGIVRTIVLMWLLRARFALGASPQALADAYGYARRPQPAAAAIAVLAKAPVPGLAKTRLARTLGERAAARAQRNFTLQTVQAAQAAALGPLTLHAAPDTGHRFFRALQRGLGVALVPQAGGDLGRRMAAIAADHFRAQPELPLLLIGTDCPLLSPGHLQAAARALATHDAVLIPALDGGYALLGLRRPIPTVFEDIAWSTSEVLAQTRARLRAARATWHEAAPLWDVDDGADWERLAALLPPRPTPEDTPA